MRTWILMVAASVMMVGHRNAVAQATRADTAAWLADYAALKHELERSYAHLAWVGSPQSGTDLQRLDRRTREALQRAQTDSEAAAAVRRFVAGFRDGHLAEAATAEPATTTTVEPPTVNSASDARTACAAFGYAPLTRTSFSLPFETLPGFMLIADGLGDAFRAGVIEQSGLRIGIVRIPRFRAAEYPAVCERVWTKLRASDRDATRPLVAMAADEEWLSVLAERLASLKARGAAAVIVDIAGNAGGNDLGDWAVRLFTRADVLSPPLLLAAGPVAVPYFDEQLGDLREALAAAPATNPMTRSALQTAIAEFERRKADAGAMPCDMSWVWSEQRAWGTSSCTRLIPSGFMSGALPFATPGSFDAQSAHALYWASRADSVRGAWDGAAYVLTNSGTGSAAEGFAALMRDRGIAKIIGSRTWGDGCGFMVYDTPVVLPHSQLAFRIPNCVRLRADGTDEVAAVTPDIPIAPLPGESARGVAARVLLEIAKDRGTPR